MAIYTLGIIGLYGVSAGIVNECIVYEYPGDNRPGILAVYFLATCAAFFLSSYRSVRWIGAANVAGFIIAYNAYRFHYASVWCFFAAIVSGLIYLYFDQRKRRAAKPSVAI